MDEMTDTKEETEINFGYVYINFCTWIYNMRVTYPHLEIVLAFVDISLCFRFPQIFADLVGAFGFAIGTLYFTANAMVFGSIASASSCEPFHVAIGAITTALFFRKELVVKHQELLDMIQWDEPPPASITFVLARA